MNKRVINAFALPKGRYGSHPPEGLNAFNKAMDSHVRRISDINIKGKFMYWSFDDGWHMFSTFGMSGQWSMTAGKHPCFGFSLGEESFNFETIYFNDPRHFGTIKFTSSKKELNDKLNDLGWDPLAEPDINIAEKIYKILHKSPKPIGELLMDQKIFAGVGNYLRAEALYVAKISPWTSGNFLSFEKIKELCQAIIKVMQDSYAHQGATIHTYKDAYGKEGKYSSCFKVYGQKKDPMGNIIKREKTPEGRTIHWCPAIQSP